MNGSESKEPDADESETFAAAWRAAALKLDGIAGYPALPFVAGRSVTPGEANWRLFTTGSSVADLVRVVEAARVFVTVLPMPPEDVLP